MDANPADPRLPRRIVTLTRATKWTPVAAIGMKFRTFHPQGMVKIGRNFFVSSVEIRTLPKALHPPQGGHDRDTGSGIGHLFKIGPDGHLLADLVVGEGVIYHPGGIDFDGTSIWLPVAEYRPASRSIIYKVDPDSMKATEFLRVDDHIGAIVHDVDDHTLRGVSWGSREMYSWRLAADGSVDRRSGAARVANPGQYVDYQDCHYVGANDMLCAGLGEYAIDAGDTVFQLGGIDLVDLQQNRPVWQAPIALRAPSGRVMTQNPFFLEAIEGGLRAYFMPDDDVSTLFVFDTAAR